MSSLDLATLWRRIAADHPQRPALVHGNRTLTWRQFDAQAATVGAAWRSHGLKHGDVVALALPNVPEHLVCVAACLRAGLVPANVNYRYTGPELSALLELLAPAAVVISADHHAAAATRPTAGTARWYSVGNPPCGWAQPLEKVLLAGPPAPEDDPAQSDPEDVIIKCSGGTTGQPAAFRWRVGDVTANLNANNPWLPRLDDPLPPPGTPIPVADARLVLASPLMHGSGQTRALGALCAGGTVVTLPKLAPGAVWEAVACNRADTLAIVGDPMARPLAAHLTRNPARRDLGSLRTITSSGAPWSREVKQVLLTCLPRTTLVETLGATEATGLGSSTAVAGQVPATGVFILGPRAAVLRPDGTRAAVGETGLLAVTGPHPLGLHPVGALPEDRFTTSGGERFLLSGDHARLRGPRQIELLGRGSECVNVGGEKVYTPEVTKALLRHPGVIDAVVLPQPHPVLGYTLAALVQSASHPLDTRHLVAYLERELAPYKIPRRIVRVGDVPRTDAGKLDLAAARNLLDRTGSASD